MPTMIQITTDCDALSTAHLTAEKGDHVLQGSILRLLRDEDRDYWKVAFRGRPVFIPKSCGVRVEARQSKELGGATPDVGDKYDSGAARAPRPLLVRPRSGEEAKLADFVSEEEGIWAQFVLAHPTDWEERVARLRELVHSYIMAHGDDDVEDVMRDLERLLLTNEPEPPLPPLAAVVSPVDFLVMSAKAGMVADPLMTGWHTTFYNTGMHERAESLLDKSHDFSLAQLILDHPEDWEEQSRRAMADLQADATIEIGGLVLDVRVAMLNLQLKLVAKEATTGQSRLLVRDDLAALVCKLSTLRYIRSLEKLASHIGAYHTGRARILASCATCRELLSSARSQANAIIADADNTEV